MIEAESAEGRGENHAEEHDGCAGNRLEQEATDGGDKEAGETPAFGFYAGRARDDVGHEGVDQDEDGEATGYAPCVVGSCGVLRRGAGFGLDSQRGDVRRRGQEPAYTEEMNRGKPEGDAAASGEHYDRFVEAERARLEFCPVEFAITKRYLERYVPEGWEVAEVGAGVGHYSEFLARRGCRVHLVDVSERGSGSVWRAARKERAGFMERYLATGTLDPKHAPPVGYAHMTTIAEFRELLTQRFEEQALTGTESFTMAWQEEWKSKSEEDRAAWLEVVEATGKTVEGMAYSDHFLFIGRRN